MSSDLYIIAKRILATKDMSEWERKYNSFISGQWGIALAACFKSTGDIHINGNGACYGGISRVCLGNDCLMVGIKEVEDKHLDFMRYVSEESFWADCFISNTDEAVEDKFYIMNNHLPANKVIGGAQLIRQVWEYPAAIDAFNVCVEHGARKEDAFIISQMFTYHNGQMAENMSRHSTFDNSASFTPVALRNMYNCTPTYLTAAAITGCNYYGMSCMFYSKKEIMYWEAVADKDVIDKAKAAVRMSLKADDVDNVNPFAMKKKAKKTDIELFLKLVDLDQYKTKKEAS